MMEAQIKDNRNDAKVVIIGRGNVGTHLFRALSPHCDVTLAAARSADGALLPEVSLDANIYLLTVTDNAIAPVAAALAAKLGERCPIVAHTSGTTDIQALVPLFRRAAVFYPLQTFSRDAALRYDTVPVFLEAIETADCAALTALAKSFTDKISIIDSLSRRKLHIASVFACNFANNCVAIADELLDEEGIDRECIAPLIAETFAKLTRGRARDMQTGPASRNDTTTMEAHLNALSDKPLLRQIYAAMSESIQTLKN